MKTITLPVPTIEYKEFDLMSALQDKLCFDKHTVLLNGWEYYKLPEGKQFIYIYYEYDIDGCYESEIGFLVLESDENPQGSELKQFCIDNIHRIIHADPADR